jgi:hypothetical protein
MAQTKTQDSTSPYAEQLAAQGAKGWKPEPGDTLTGVVVGITPSNPGEYGIYPIVTIRKDDGELVALHAFHATLKNRLIEKRPVAGEVIAVQFHGERESKKEDSRGRKRTYNSYAVVVDRPDSEANTSWDSFAPEDAKQDEHIFDPDEVA